MRKLVLAFLVVASSVIAVSGCKNLKKPDPLKQVDPGCASCSGGGGGKH